MKPLAGPNRVVERVDAVEALLGNAALSSREHDLVTGLQTPT